MQGGYRNPTHLVEVATTGQVAPQTRQMKQDEKEGAMAVDCGAVGQVEIARRESCPMSCMTVGDFHVSAKLHTRRFGGRRPRLTSHNATPLQLAICRLGLSANYTSGLTLLHASF
jgi:hypothetical protein